MKPRNNPTIEQFLRRLQREPITASDPRVKKDPYWALRLQGHSHSYAKRVLRDVPPRYTKENPENTYDYISDVDADEIFVEPGDTTDLQKLSVVVRPELTEETAASAAPRSTEYTIPSDYPPGFGLRVRKTGSKSYIVVFRIKGTNEQVKITLAKYGEIPFELARDLAVAIKIEALSGNDPRKAHKSGEILKKLK